MRSLVNLGLMAVLCGLTCVAAETTKKFDDVNKFEAADIVGMVLGYALTLSMLAFILIRLCWEERKRSIQFKQGLQDAENEASKFDITYEKIMQAEAEKREREQEEIFGK